MKKFLFIVCFFFVHSLFGQYTDTANMRIIEQNRSAIEGDMYLDTNAKVYKIGLTNGQLGFLTDNQTIDSLRVINDSLFFFISGAPRKGISLISLQKSIKKDTGLTYFLWNLPNNNEPDISLVSSLGVSASQGITQAELDDNLKSTLAPSASNRFLILFSGTLRVTNTGVFNFSTTANAGTRIYVDGILIVNNWSNGNNNNNVTSSNSVNLAQGEHKIEFWYYETVGQDFMEFNWGVNPDGYVVGSKIESSQFNIR